jgi:hypothetical protein
MAGFQPRTSSALLIPIIMRQIAKGGGKGTAKVWSYPGMEKLVQTLRKKIEGVSELFTLDACRHGGMTELEGAELTEGQGRALSGHKTAQAYRRYAKETMRRALAASLQSDVLPAMVGPSKSRPPMNH